MRNTKRSQSLKGFFILSVAVLSGCATSGTKSGSEDAIAAVKSQAYLDNVTFVPSGQKKDSASCALPKDAEKAEVNQKIGPSKDWRPLVARANSCVSEKNWRTLESLANLLAKKDMDSPWGAYYLSISAEGIRDYPRAIWMIDLAQKKAGGRSGLFLYQKGKILLSMNETGKAMVEIRKAVQIEPNLAEGHLFLAEVHHRDLEYDAAAGHYAAALNADGVNYRALTGLAEVKLVQEKSSEAAKLYEKAVSEHPQQLRPWVRLAFIYESVQKNNQLALSTYKSLKTKLDTGKLREKPDFDINAKIKSLEEVVTVPAHVSASVSSSINDGTRSAK